MRQKSRCGDRERAVRTRGDGALGSRGGQLRSASGAFGRFARRAGGGPAESGNRPARGPEANSVQTKTLEAKKGARTASGDTIEYHCMVANAGAIVSYTYTIGNEAHIGRLFVSCQ